MFSLSLSLSLSLCIYRSVSSYFFSFWKYFFTLGSVIFLDKSEIVLETEYFSVIDEKSRFGLKQTRFSRVPLFKYLGIFYSCHKQSWLSTFCGRSSENFPIVNQLITGQFQMNLDDRLMEKFHRELHRFPTPNIKVPSINYENPISLWKYQTSIRGTLTRHVPPLCAVTFSNSSQVISPATVRPSWNFLFCWKANRPRSVFNFQ